jgi:hypothetical protein
VETKQIDTIIEENAARGNINQGEAVEKCSIGYLRFASQKGKEPKSMQTG